jgi:hypothetical protein
MKLSLLVCGLLGFSALASAQRGAVFGGRTNVSPSGFGNVVFPGTGGPPIVRNSLGAFPPSSFASRLGATVGGFRQRGGYGRYGSPFVGAYGQGGGYGYGGIPAVVPYPIFVGGYGGFGSYPQDPNVTIIYQQPPPGYQQPVQPSSPVTINQNFGAETTREEPRAEAAPTRPDLSLYQPAEPRPAVSADAANELPYYLIAYKDSSIHSAVGFWQDGDTLHYLTAGNVHNQASIDLIDIETTERLNRSRKVPPVQLIRPRARR